MFRLSRILGLVALAAGSLVVSPVQVSHAADPAPYYENETSSCTATSNTKPCHVQDGTDAYFVRMGECGGAVTNFCYTATKSDGSALPSTVKFLAGVSAYKVHTSSVDIAGYESFINAYYVPSGATLNEEYFGSGQRPVDQSGNSGKLDLSPALSATDSIKVIFKYKTTAVPQYSVLVSDQGSMSFSMSGQNLTATLEGKPAKIAIDSASQHINFDTEKDDDTTKPWTNRCGIPSMQFVVCNVDTAAADALTFFARTKTFVFGNAATVPGPIWVSTNATYFHFPSIKTNEAAGTKSLEVKTAAPHRLSNGTTLHTGNFTAFLPNGILTEWKVDKTEDALKRLLAGTIEKSGSTSSVAATFAITDSGVKVVFPQIDYSAPTMKVSTLGTAATTTTTIATTTIAPTTTTTAPAVRVGKLISRTVIAKAANVTIPAGAKVSLALAASSKKFCSLSGTSVKGVKAGSCSVTISVTPKATKSTPKPKTTKKTVRISVS